MKKRLTRGEKWLFASPLLFLVLVGVAWIRQKSVPRPAPDFIQLPSDAVGTSLSFSPDSRRLVAFFQVARSRTVLGQIYDAKTCAVVSELKLPVNFKYGSRIGTPAWSADGKRVVIVSTFKKVANSGFNRILLWDAGSGALKADNSYPASRGELYWREIRFAGDGKTLVGGGVPPAVYSIATGKRLNKLDLSVDQYRDYSQQNAGLLALRNRESLDFRVVESGSRQVIWKPEIMRTRSFEWQGAMLSVRGSSLQGGTVKDCLWLWDSQKRQVLSPPSIAPDASIYDYVLNPDGKTLVYISRTRTKKWFSSGYKVELVAYDYRANRELWRNRSNEELTLARWSPDGKRLAVMVSDNFYSPNRIFDMKGNLQAEDKVSHSFISSWSPDSKQLASFCIDNLNRPNQRYRLEIHRLED